GDRWAAHARPQAAFFKRLAAARHGPAAFADDEGSDRRLARRSAYAADVEAQPAQLFLEEAGVLPELLNAFRLLLQDVKRCDAGGGDRRRMRSRKQERPRAVIEVVNQVF